MRNVIVSASAIVVAFVAACATSEPTAVERGETEPEVSSATGAEALFARQCALCHGIDGDGVGPASRLLEPRPRDFGSGRFALASTDNGMPTNADLVATLRRGMPGSAMPSFDWLEQGQLQALAAHVRNLAESRLAANLRRESHDGVVPLSASESRTIARGRLIPGRVLLVADAGPATPEALARGKRLYLERCSACHAPDGTGLRPVEVWQRTNDIRFARDFTAGVLKGGASNRDLTCRIVSGMPAVGMPPTLLDDPADQKALVAYVRTLIPDGAASRFVQKRAEIRAQRVDSVATSPSAKAWEKASEARIALAPMQWHEDTIKQAYVACLTDGNRIAIRIRWKDATSDDRGASFSDAVALQFSAAKAPPVFGMGAHDEPVTIWHWKAFRLRDVAGFLDLVDRPPHARRGKVDAPIYTPAPELGSGETMQAKGMETLDAHRRRAITVRARSERGKNEWSVVLLRELAPRSDGEIDLRGSKEVAIGVAIWNGSRGAGAKGKSFTIWHRLVLPGEPKR